MNYITKSSCVEAYRFLRECELVCVLCSPWGRGRPIKPKARYKKQAQDELDVALDCLNKADALENSRIELRLLRKARDLGVFWEDLGLASEELDDLEEHTWEMNQNGTVSWT
jgi:hypothetical protein